jgi:hypothetical protein
LTPLCLPLADFAESQIKKWAALVKRSLWPHPARQGCDWRTGIETLLLLFDLGYWQLAVHDPSGRFFYSTTLSEKNFIKDLHDYADSVHSGISHYDITAFHGSDSDLAAEFQEIERDERRKKPV